MYNSNEDSLFLYSSEYNQHIREMSRELSPVVEKVKSDKIDHSSNLLPSALRKAMSPLFPVSKHRSRAVIKSFSASGLSLIIPSGNLTFIFL